MRDSGTQRTMVPHGCPRRSPDRSMGSVPDARANQARSKPEHVKRSSLFQCYPSRPIWLMFFNWQLPRLA
jgi:hypothetical protein